jgi:predicted metalloprotease with PDZ domain
LCRAGIITDKQYVEGLARTFNYVWNSPGTKYFNPIEMSYQAPFVDAASFLDPTSRTNTFISYYSYGSVLGLALDLSLRELFTEKNLDGFMALTYQKYGKKEIPYTVADLEETLGEYTNVDFSNSFFNNYIYQSSMPDYQKLFQNFGVNLTQNKQKVFFGADIDWNNGTLKISSYPIVNSPFYNAGLSKDDVLITINKQQVFKDFFEKYQFKPQDKLAIVFERFGVRMETEVLTTYDPSYTTKLSDTKNEKILKNRKEWLTGK